MDAAVPLRERVLAAAAATPSLTRRQGRRLALLGVALSGSVAVALRMILRLYGGPGGDVAGEGVRLAEGWTLAAGALTCLVLGRSGSTLVRSPQLLRAATWATPVVLLLWLARFPERAGPLAGAAPCVALALALAATPLATFLALRRGAEPHCPATLGAAAGAMCGAWAEVLLLLWCPVRGVAHGALAHALPVALLAAAGAAAGRRVLAFAPARKPAPSIDVYLVERSPIAMRATGAVCRSILRILVAALGTSGCTANLSGAQHAEPDFSSSIRRGSCSVRVGESRLLERGTRPASGAGVEGPAARVELDGARFVVCWTRGSVETGHRALAQTFDLDGTPRGAPAVISPPGMDVVGAPHAVTSDGRHVVATFDGWSGGGYERVAVELADVTEPRQTTTLSARR
jgi:hypothetical protein